MATTPKVYMDLFLAQTKGEDGQIHLDALKALPLHERYTWRVASALKWAFADFDSYLIKLDMATLSPEDKAKIRESLQFRSLQFQLLLEALVA